MLGAGIAAGGADWPAAAALRSAELLLPLSPMWGAVAMPRSKIWRIGVLAACLLGQWWWIYNMYALGNTYWQIP